MPVPQNSKRTPSVTYEAIVREVQAGNIKPVYYLMGEESYYIDRIADLIVASVLLPEERDFNLVTLFGAETNVDNVINMAKGFPMGAKRLVVHVKEAQALQNIDRLEYYLGHPQASTVLILCHKNGTIDRRKKIVRLIEKCGVLFESKKLYDSQLPTFVKDYLRRKKVSIAPEAAALMGEFVGSDLNRMASELDKLCLSLPENASNVTVEMVKQNIGMSRDFNIFELQEALVNRNVLEANLIAKYFDLNPKANAIQKTLSMLFRFFSNLMLSFYAPDKSERGLAAWLGMSEWQIRRNVLPAMRNYSGTKVLRIIGEIRRTDARSKGVDNPGTSNGDLMKELLFFILH